MEVLFVITVGVMTSCGVYLLLRARIVPVVMGLTLLSYAVNLFIFAMGRLNAQTPAILGTAGAATHADPVPQALVLTAIVIGFAMTAFVLALALRHLKTFGTDHVDSREPEACP